MARRKDEILKKLEYLGLDLTKVPKSLVNKEDLEYRVPKFYDERQYKQYRYVKVKDIQILLTPSNRLDDLEEKYKKASPIEEYLDSENEENFTKHATFLKMLKDVKIEKIDEIEEEQEKLNKNIPFKVKFKSNYLWQIYYSKNTDKYFMLVPTEDSEYEAFFYLLKKKIENKRNAKIFVPISGIDYTNEYLRKSEIQDIQNYIWLFTKSWPLIYEVYDKNDSFSLQIIGETFVFGKIKSLYKVKLEEKQQAIVFYKLIKAMFILQTELPNYFKFRTNIGENGNLDFYKDNIKIEYKEITQWLKDEFLLCIQQKDVADDLISSNTEKLNALKSESVLLDLEYIEKEKQISTFLECKKSFFGKFKYYFKYSKGKKKKEKNKNEENIETNNKAEEKVVSEEKKLDKKNYTIEEIIQNYKELEVKENNLKNILMDINALKLKNKNLNKKIQNASDFIKEIDSHKKSIFEFWKYSNKDEMKSLPEGEEEEINVIKKITRVFDYEEDIEDFGKKYDRVLRKKLSQEQTDALFITNTNVLDILNKIKNNEIMPKDLENNLKQIKKEAIEEKTLSENEEFDIFGGISSDTTKISIIKDKKHRELPKDKYRILEVSKTTKQIGYKLVLEQIINNIKASLENVEIDEELPIYKILTDEQINKNNINIFNINPVEEISEKINLRANNFQLYKINLSGKVNAIPYTNIIFYDNQNKTLPIGMDISTKILIDINKLELKEKEKYEFNIIDVENKEDEFSNIIIKKINVLEYDIS